MPSAISNIHEEDFHIPTVDIGPYLANPNADAAEKIVDAVRLACTTSGFFQLVGHGIPAELRRAMFAGAKAFFDKPVEEKQACGRTTARGYETIGSQALQYDTLPDMKEGFYIGEDIPVNPEAKYRPFLEPNLWPALPDDIFKTPMKAYFAQVSALANTVLDIIGRALPYDNSVLDVFKEPPIAASMRLLHYPPQKSNDAKQLGAGAHTDFGFITLLLTDGHPGLQVLNNATGAWVGVPPNEDAFVVNIGDMLDSITDGYLKSNTHRVINLGDEHRYSVPYFYDGNLDTKLARLDGGKQDRVLTVEEHMHERFATTYGRGEKNGETK